MSSEWPDAQISNIQKTLQNSWQIPYISLFARTFCDVFHLFDFHQEELEDALLSDDPNEIHPFLQELLISLLSGLIRLHVNSSNMFVMLTNVLKRCDLTVTSSSSSSSMAMSISDDSVTTTEWQEMSIFEKVTILRVLCDARLNRADTEQVIEDMPAASLRFEPFGEDSRGNKLWYFGDTRLYCDFWNKSTETSTWECVCRTLDEWNTFIENFRKTCSKKNSSIKDRTLLGRLVALNNDLPDIYSRKDRDRHRRWTSYEPKRASTRLETKRQQRLEFEEITQEQKARHDKFLEYKRRQEETIAKEKERLERTERVKRREERASRIRRRTAAGSVTTFDASEFSENSNTSSTLNDENSQHIDTSDIHQKVLTMLRTNENSWLFLEPVTEELAPNYFTLIENPMDLSTVQQKITNKMYVNNSAEFIRDIELMVANCEQYNGKRSILGRLASRLLHYFKECWSECQPMASHLDDDDDMDDSNHRESSVKKTTVITRDRNNNRRTKTNYRQLAGLSDDDEDNEPDYTPMPTSKRTRHSAPAVPVYITVDPNSTASLVYHDHSYFIRHESTNSSLDNSQRRKSMVPTDDHQSQVENKSSLPTVQVLNQLFFEHQQKTKSPQLDFTSPTNPVDFTTILRAFLVKQGHHLSTTIPIETKLNDHTHSPPSSTTAS